MAHYRIVPDRSQVLIDAKSSLHPIRTRTDGLDGSLDIEVLGGGRVNLHPQPFAKLSFPVDRLKSGNPLEDRELSGASTRAAIQRSMASSLSCVRQGKTGAISRAVISRSAV